MTELEVVEIPRGSLEYVCATTSADVALADDMTVEISLTPLGTSDHTWRPAQWVGAEATTRVARTTDPVVFAAGTYTVFVRLTDIPEIPIMVAYTIAVT